MKSSEILREAARLVESEQHTFSCHAISDAAGIDDLCSTDTEAHKAYAILLGRLPSVSDIWHGMTGNRQEVTNVRVMALCLAAAIAESEGD